MDLGTANTLIIHNDKVVVDQPSIVAKDRMTGQIIAVGKKAMQMHGKTHEDIKTIRPLKDGVIADFDAAEHMIRGMILMMSDKKPLITPSKGTRFNAADGPKTCVTFVTETAPVYARATAQQATRSAPEQALVGSL